MGTVTRIMSFYLFPNVTTHLRIVINEYNLIDEHKGVFKVIFFV